LPQVLALDENTKITEYSPISGAPVYHLIARSSAQGRAKLSTSLMRFWTWLAVLAPGRDDSWRHFRLHWMVRRAKSKIVRSSCPDFPQNFRLWLMVSRQASTQREGGYGMQDSTHRWRKTLGYLSSPETLVSPPTGPPVAARRLHRSRV
jgi:hypothetical protein